MVTFGLGCLYFAMCVVVENDSNVEKFAQATNSYL
jgi:hypothetical protein